MDFENHTPVTRRLRPFRKAKKTKHRSLALSPLLTLQRGDDELKEKPTTAEPDSDFYFTGGEDI